MKQVRVPGTFHHNPNTATTSTCAAPRSTSFHLTHSVSHSIYLTLSLSYRMELLSTTFKWFKSFDLISIILKNSISLCILLYYYNTQSERVAQAATAKEEEKERESVCVWERDSWWMRKKAFRLGFAWRRNSNFGLSTRDDVTCANHSRIVVPPPPPLRLPLPLLPYSVHQWIPSCFLLSSPLPLLPCDGHAH